VGVRTEGQRRSGSSVTMPSSAASSRDMERPVTSLERGVRRPGPLLRTAAARSASPTPTATRGGSKPAAPAVEQPGRGGLGTAHALIRDTEQILAQAVTGRARPRRGWSDRNTARALEGHRAPRLRHAAGHSRAGTVPLRVLPAVRDLNGA